MPAAEDAPIGDSAASFCLMGFILASANARLLLPRPFAAFS